MSQEDSFQNLIAPLEAWATRTPDAVAVEDESGRSLTYAGLNSMADSVAVALRRRGVRRGDRVGLCMPKSINSVAAIFGVLKAGAAYVPVDHASPAARNRFIFANCEIKAVVTDGPRAALLGGNVPARLVFPGDAGDGVGAPWLNGEAPADRPAEPAGRDDLSYILYTSGSTGDPKGVVHTHGSATSFVNWAGETFRPGPGDRFSSHSPFHFDLSILDLFVPLTVGAAIILVPEELGKSPRDLGPYIAWKKISIWYSVPSILALLDRYGKLERDDFGALRMVLFAGEVFPVKHLRSLKKRWPGKAFFNLYGPTETNVCTWHAIPDVIPDDRTQPYPIGKACANVEAQVLDADRKPVDAQGEGILYVHASGPVMRGYWKLPEQDAAVFHSDADGRRWYCTGDVVSDDPEGNYLFVGRRDRMVKRLGYRIELGEIEAGLHGHPSILEAAVAARENSDGPVLVAHVAPEKGAKLSIIELKEYCTGALPPYMNPDRFCFVEQLPRLSNDKIDYVSLMKQG